MCFWVSSVIHPGLDELCLLALFPFCTVLLVLLVGAPLGGYQFLVVLLIWLLLVLVLCRRLLLMVVVRRFSWVRSSGPGRKRIRLNRKLPAHLAGFAVQSRPRVWKRIASCGFFLVIPFLLTRGRRRDQDYEEYIPAQDRTVLAHVSRLARSLITS